MTKSGFSSQRFSSNTKTKISNVTSLTLSNYGDTPLEVIVNDVPRTVPAFNPSVGVPLGSFNVPGDGTRCDLDIEIRFTGGKGNAILDYRVYKPQEC